MLIAGYGSLTPFHPLPLLCCVDKGYLTSQELQRVLNDLGEMMGPGEVQVRSACCVQVVVEGDSLFFTLFLPLHPSPPVSRRNFLAKVPRLTVTYTTNRSCSNGYVGNCLAGKARLVVTKLIHSHTPRCLSLSLSLSRPFTVCVRSVA